MSKKIIQYRKKIFKYLLIGSNGLLGSELKKILPKNESLFIARKKSDYNIDLSNFNDLKKVFEKYKFLNVINVFNNKFRNLSKKKIFVKK